ncbi:MAG: nucleotide sugar dehydrogenase [Nitriliruptorales bacterium]|nr:nucleotide sugar dehydrogenase [Nitriliruptorales bacterium]
MYPPFTPDPRGENRSAGRWTTNGFREAESDTTVTTESPRAKGIVAVMGLGYVGLPTSLGLVDAGYQVIGIDIDPSRLTAIRSGRVDLPESDHPRLATALAKQRLILSSDPVAVQSTEAVLVCVPTPLDAHRLPSLTALERACDDVVRNAVPGQLIVLTSTSYVGTTSDLLVVPLLARGLTPGRDIHVAFAPERIDPGNQIFPQEAVPRVVGGVTSACAERACALLGPIVGGLHVASAPVVAELSKLLENTFRAVNIALANELADISATLGLDPMEVINAAATKPYGFMPFYPGAGAGGHCIPVDPHYLLWQLRPHSLTTPVIGQAMEALAARPGRMVDRAVQLLSDAGKGLRGARVLMTGVAYKPGVADLRCSPALDMIQLLAERGAEVAYHDPLVDQVRLAEGHPVRSDPAPLPEDYDLVVVYGLQPGFDYAWLDRCRLLLDCTYRLGIGAEIPATGELRDERDDDFGQVDDVALSAR